MSETNEPRTPQTTRPSRMDALATLPIFFKLKGQRAVLAGGTEPALWKAELLAAAGAHVDVYAGQFAEGFAHLAAHPPAGSITPHTRAWTPDDVKGAAIAIGAIPDDAEASAFVAAANTAGAPVNVIDRPEFCAFQFGAIVNRSPLVDRWGGACFRAGNPFAVGSASAARVQTLGRSSEALAPRRQSPRRRYAGATPFLGSVH